MIHGQKQSHEVPAIFLPEGLFARFFSCFFFALPIIHSLGHTPYNDLYEEVPPDGGGGGVPFQGFGPVRGGVRISLIEIYERAEKSVIFRPVKRAKSLKSKGFVIHKFFTNSGFTAVKRDVKF